MKNIFFYLAAITILSLSCKSPKYEKHEDGVIVSVHDSLKICIKVVSDNILHVQASPTGEFTDTKSLMIVDFPTKNIKWDLQETDNGLTVSTAKVKATVSLSSGALTFTDSIGNIKLVEMADGGKIFQPVIINKKNYYTIRQIFESPDDEAFYGLGAHQHNIMNYKGKDVDLYQHNIVDIVPFIVSSRNYGILWDNYSHSKFGDPRDYENITSLELFSSDGTVGGLDATYSDRNDNNKIYTRKKEEDISYEFLDDLKTVPSGFPLGTGKVTWEGFLASKESGIHKFQAYSAGYLKLWFNGELLLDTWRQCWNPWSHLLDLNLQAGQKYPVKIEWIPDGGESYVSIKYKSPYDAKDQQRLSLWSEVAHEINYYYIAGEDFDEIISGYRYLTGKSPVMPKWAMGFWQSRERYKTQDELLSTVQKFRKLHIPLDNIVLDWFYWPEDKWGDHNFDSSRFADPQGMIEQLHKLNTQIMISVWPKLYLGTENNKYMNEKGWLFTKNIQNQQKDWVGYVSTFYDVFNPEARNYFWEQMNKKLFSKGVDAWWMDATEPDILSNTSIEQRKELMTPMSVGTSAEYFNAYSLQNSKAVYEGQRKTNPDQRVFILTRSAYAGQQRYASATWSGDVACRWYDLKAQISAGLNFAISGIPYWTSDIGGFSLESRFYEPKGEDLNEWRELNTRWYQFGVFCPLFRVHGQFPFREIFNIAPETHPAYQSMLFYNKLRYRLMPYIYTLAGNTYHTDYTIMRALIMEFPADKNVHSIGDQFMFGPSIMVCPVYEYKLRERSVYLPSGTGWYDFYTGEYYEGGQSITALAPYERVPLYIREGSIIPIGPEIEYAMQPTDGELTLWIYKGRDCKFNIYEDEGLNYNYENGNFAQIPVRLDNTNNSVIIGQIEGSFDGMYKSRKVNVIVVDNKAANGFDVNQPPLRTIIYKGEEQIIGLE